MADIGLDGTLAELRAMSAHEQRAVLRLLDASQRRLVEQRLRAPSPPPAEPPSLSPWLSMRLNAARGGSQTDATARMTPAARAALVRCAEQDAPSPAPISRSLIGAMGSFIAPRRGRP